MDTFCPATLRLFRQAVNPRTQPLTLFEIAWLLTALLSEAGCSADRLEAVRDAVQKPDPLEAEDDSGAVVADRLLALAKKLTLAMPGRIECIAVLRAQSYKRDPSPARAHYAVTHLTHPGHEAVGNALGQRRFDLYVRHWKKRAVLNPLAEPEIVVIRTSLQKALDVVLAGEPAEAVEDYKAVVEQYLRKPGDESRAEIESVADKLPFRVMTVARAIQREGSDGNKNTRSYLPLEIPLPMLAPASSAEKIIALLRSEFPWLSPAVDAIEMDLLVCKRFLGGVPSLVPKLFVGSAGCGKTTLCSRLSSLLDQPSAIVNAAGAASTRLLTGTTRGWGGSRPSLPAEIMAQALRAQATIVIDEIDKEGRGGDYGRFSDGLLNFLEPSSSTKYFDECLFASCDFSGINWLATANDLGPVSAPLLSRFQVIVCGQPRAEHMPAIAQSTLRSLRLQYRLPDSHELLDPQARMEVETLAPCSQSARACAHLVRQKVGEALRREFQSSDRTEREVASPATRMH